MLCGLEYRLFENMWFFSLFLLNFFTFPNIYSPFSAPILYLVFILVHSFTRQWTLIKSVMESIASVQCYLDWQRIKGGREREVGNNRFQSLKCYEVCLIASTFFYFKSYFNCKSIRWIFGHCKQSKHMQTYGVNYIIFLSSLSHHHLFPNFSVGYHC